MTTASLRLEPTTPEVWAGICEGLPLDEADLPRVDPSVTTAWWVIAGHALVGVVAEYREWVEGRCRAATYDVVHNPTAGPFEALWRSQGHGTPEAALDALVAHLLDAGGDGVIRAESLGLRVEATGPGSMHARYDVVCPNDPTWSGHEPEEG